TGAECWRDARCGVPLINGTGQRPVPPLSQKPREIFFFPPARTAVTRKFPLALVKFFRVNATASIRPSFIRNHRMQHLVIKNVTEEPRRHERLIEERINPDYAVFFLDGAENEILFRAPLPFPAPRHFVTAQLSAEVALVQPIEVCSKIEISSFMLQVEMQLHRQLRVGDFSFCFLCLVRPFRFSYRPSFRTFYRRGIFFTNNCVYIFLSL